MSLLIISFDISFDALVYALLRPASLFVWLLCLVMRGHAPVFTVLYRYLAFSLVTTVAIYRIFWLSKCRCTT